MPDWLFYAIVTTWVLWSLDELCVWWIISHSWGRRRSTWGSVCLHLYGVFTVFLGFYIFMGLAAIEAASSLIGG